MTILIHKGDDTIFGPQEKFITFIFETELDLTGWKAQFKLGGFTKVIEDISSKQFDITISHSTTVQLPLGKLNGSIVLTDNNNRIKTVINTIPFVVTKDVVEQQYETIDLTIPKSSGVDIKMRIGGRAVYSINGKTGEVVLTAEDVGAIPEDSITTLATYEYVDASIANTQAELDDTNARLNQKANIDYVDEELDLKADKTEVARKANISDIPTRVSQLVNDEGYLTEHQDISGKADIDYVDEALGYKADKSDTYTKVEVDTIIDELALESGAVTSVNGMTGDVVVDVPDVSVFATKGQLITGLSTKQDKGDYALKSDIPNLDDYVKNTDYATVEKGGVVKAPNSSFGIALNNSKQLYVFEASSSDIASKTNHYRPITPYNLDLAVKTGVTTNTIELTDDEKTSARTWLGAVGDTDYASSSKAGVVKTNVNTGVSITSGLLYVVKATDDDIQAKTSNYKTIVPNNLDYAVKTGVTTNTIQLTEDEKASAKAWLGYVEPTDVLQAIASIPQFKMVIVDALPETGEKMTLYFVPKEGTEGDIYNEYVWIDETQVYEFLGSTAVDLTDYVKNTDYATTTKHGVVSPDTGFGTAVNSSGKIYLVKASDTAIGSKTSLYNPITPANLDLAVKTGVTTNTIELTEDEKTSARTWLGAISNTDFAQGAVAGVIKTSAYYGVGTNAQGFLLASQKNLSDYDKGDNAMFVAKGTLENVLTQYATNEKIGEVEDLLDEINGGTSLLTTKTVVTTEADYNALETKDANTLYLIEE